jgi:hypothetical protein
MLVCKPMLERLCHVVLRRCPRLIAPLVGSVRSRVMVSVACVPGFSLSLSLSLSLSVAS